MSVHAEYLSDWAKQLKIPVEAGFEWKICEYLINTAKNYDSAAALMFELSWKTNRDYLDRVVPQLTAWHKQAGCCKVTGNDLYTFVDYYVKEIEHPPKANNAT